MLLLPQDQVGPLKSASHLQSDSPRLASANWPAKSSDMADKSVSVDLLKEIGRATPQAATVNDVLLAALAGALRRHVLAGASNRDVNKIQSVVWVSLLPFRDLFRPASAAAAASAGLSDNTVLPLTWGDTNLGAVYLELPIDEADCAKVRKQSFQTLFVTSEMVSM